jgi:hypothetical protein
MLKHFCLGDLYWVISSLADPHAHGRNEEQYINVPFQSPRHVH